MNDIDKLVDETVARANKLAEATTDPTAVRDAILRELRARFRGARLAKLADYKFPEEDPRR